LSISAQGTGTVDVQSPMTTVAQTISGNVTVPDGFITELGNIQIYSNTLTSTTNGNINIVANGTGQISLQSAVTSAYQVNAVSFRASDTVDTNRVRSYSSNADIVVEPQGTGNINVSNSKIINLGAPSSSTDAATKAYVDSVVSAGATTFGDYTFSGNKLSVGSSNADMDLRPSGTGRILLSRPYFSSALVEKINSLTSSSTITVDFSIASTHKVTLGTNTQFVVTNLPTGGSGTIIIRQDGVGFRTAAFGTDTSTAVKFPSAAATLSSAAGAIDVVTIFNDGTAYLGNIANDYS